MKFDNYLVLKFKNGDEEAFRKIVEHFQKYIFTICYNITQNKYEAENLTQDTFLQIYRKKDIIMCDKSFKSWIGRVAVNKSIDWKRKNSISSNVFNDNVILEFEEKESLEDKILKKEKISYINKVIDKIPERYRVVVKKYYFMNKTYQEISMEENISIRTVESRLYRGKKKIKKIWKEGSLDAL